jgi:hypothetical protein
MLNALTQWSESTRLGFITPSSWCTRGGGAARLSLSVFVGFCTVREKMDSNEVVVVVVPVFFGSVQMEAMPSCWESEQKHPRGGDGGPPYLRGGQWERRVKEATKNRRGRDVTVEGGVIPKKLVRVFVMENPFCDEWQHSHPLAQQDRPIPDSRFSPASSSRSALIWELPHPSEEDDMRSHILCLDRGYTVHLFRRLPSAYLTAREEENKKKKQTTDRRMKEVDGNGNHSHFFVRVIFFLDINSKESSKFTHKVHKLKSIQFLILTAIVKSTRNQKKEKMTA